MAEYRLYCFAQSGNAYKPALMLNLCGAEWEPVFVDFFNGGARTAEYLKLNAMGEVPVLIDGERTLTQSGAILHYLADRFGRFGPETRDEGYDILRWMFWDNHKLTASIASLRFLIQFARTGETDVTKFLRGRMMAALKVLDGHLKAADFVAAARPTIADVSLCGYLFWPDEFGVSWDDYPGIAPWLARLETLDGWVHPYKLMPGHPLPAKG